MNPKTRIILQALIFVLFLVLSVFKTIKGFAEQNTLHIIMAFVGIGCSIVGLVIMINLYRKNNKSNNFFN